MLDNEFKSKVIDIIENSSAVADAPNLINEIGDKMNMGRVFTAEETDCIYGLVREWANRGESHD